VCLAVFCGSNFVLNLEALAIEGIDSIETSNYANRQLQYYYYIPETVLADSGGSHPVLIMVPGLSGRGEHFVGVEFKDFADKEEFVIIAPSFIFDEENWSSKTSYHYPKHWSGRALFDIIDKFKKKNNLSISGYYLFGVSAGAQFVLRFCIWKPDLCAACAAHAPGGRVVPVKKLDTNFFITVGRRDENFRIDIAKNFEEIAKSYGIDVKFEMYDVGHGLISPQITDSLDFFRENR